MDLTERVAALERELKAVRSEIQSPLRVVNADGQLLVEIGEDAVTGESSVCVYDKTGKRLAILCAYEDTGVLEVYCRDGRQTASMRTTSNGGEIIVSGQNGDDGVILGPDISNSQPALLILNGAGDILAYLGPGDERGGVLRLKDRNGWGQHEFPQA